MVMIRTFSLPVRTFIRWCIHNPNVLGCIEISCYWIFHFYFLNNDISVSVQVINLKFNLCFPKFVIEGSVSQINTHRELAIIFLQLIYFPWAVQGLCGLFDTNCMLSVYMSGASEKESLRLLSLVIIMLMVQWAACSIVPDQSLLPHCIQDYLIRCIPLTKPLHIQWKVSQKKKRSEYGLSDEASRWFLHVL